MESRKANVTRLLLFMLGMTAMSTQVIMIRESLAVFQGNELIIGLFLGIWMLLTAGGSFIAGQSSKFKNQKSNVEYTSTIDNRQPNIDNESPLPRSSTPLLILLAFLPLMTLFLLVTLRYHIVPYGIMPGLGETAFVISLALLPFCLVTGMLFPIMVSNLSVLKGKNLLHEGYALDSAGSILGGLLFSLVFILTLPPYESLVLLSSFCLLVLGILAIISKKTGMAILTLFLAPMVFLMPVKPEIVRFLDDLQFNKQEVIEIKSSPYGMLAVTRIGEQFFIFENGIPVNLGEDPDYCEESVHYAMLLHSSPEKLMVISGGTSGIIKEILKYPVLKVDYVNTNPWLMRLAGKYRSLSDDKHVNYFFKDPRIILSKNDEKYDVILLNTPEPTSAELNRFYTVEFFQMLKERLNPGGIISLSVPAAGNYMNETSRTMHSVYYNTLQEVFSNIRIIPGLKDYYLASDISLEHSFFQNYQLQGFTNVYVNPSYISEDLQKMRSDLIMKDLLPDAPVNSDLKPYIFSEFLKHWLSRFRVNYMVIPVSLAILTILGLIFLGPLNLGLFAGGFTSSSLEFILLIWFQVLYGFVYQMTGIIFAIFMAGLATGSFYRLSFYKNSTFRGYLAIQAVMAGFSALITILMLIIPPGYTHWMIFLFILVLVFTTGLLMGIQFSLSGHLRKTSIIKSSGESFSADLLGSAIGIALVSVYLIPQLGLPVTGLALAGLNVAVMGVMAVRR